MVKAPAVTAGAPMYPDDFARVSRLNFALFLDTDFQGGDGGALRSQLPQFGDACGNVRLGSNTGSLTGHRGPLRIRVDVIRLPIRRGLVGQRDAALCELFFLWCEVVRHAPNMPGCNYGSSVQ